VASQDDALPVGDGFGIRMRRSGVLLARGALRLVVTVCGLLTLTFSLSSLSPIDPVLRVVGDHASRQTYEEARHRLGLDESWPLQLMHFGARIVRADLGVSQTTGQPVRSDLATALPATLELATLAMLASAVLGLSLAFLTAARPGGLLDAATRVFSMIGNSMPAFWLGLVLLYVFYARLHWAGSPGRLDDAFEYTVDHHSGLVLVDAWLSGIPGAVSSAVQHLVLPVIVLAIGVTGKVARMVRAALLGEMGRDYVTLARAKGAGTARILLRHVLPNISGVVLTVLALAYASLLEGAVLTETVFAWPGLGRYLTTALFAADTPAILGATLVIGICFVILNELTDRLISATDARLA